MINTNVTTKPELNL